MVVATTQSEDSAESSQNAESQTDCFQFKEEGEQICMDINATDADFASDEEMETEHTQDSDSDEDEWASTIESGEIDSQNEDFASQSDIAEETNTKSAELQPKKRNLKQQNKRIGVEEKLDTMTDTLHVMKEFLIKSGMKGFETNVKDGMGSKKKKWNTEGGKEATFASVTTIYHNALEKIPPTEDGGIQVDEEITFKSNQTKRDSSSSKDMVNTSDEILDVDINEQFIVDCAMDAKKRSQLNNDCPGD